MPDVLRANAFDIYALDTDEYAVASARAVAAALRPGFPDQLMRGRFDDRRGSSTPAAARGANLAFFLRDLREGRLEIARDRWTWHERDDNRIIELFALAARCVY